MVFYAYGTFYFLKEFIPEKMHHDFHTIFFNIWSAKISILECFLKGYVTLKNGVMMLKIQLCITRINNILKYINIKQLF